MNLKKDWTDQPTAIAESTNLASIRVTVGKHVGTMAIYQHVKDDEPSYWLVTVGNLFGSETIRVETAEHVILLIGIISDKGRKPIELPQWAVLQENAA